MVMNGSRSSEFSPEKHIGKLKCMVSSPNALNMSWNFILRSTVAICCLSIINLFSVLVLADFVYVFDECNSHT